MRATKGGDTQSRASKGGDTRSGASKGGDIVSAASKFSDKIGIPLKNWHLPGHKFTGEIFA